MTTFADLGLCDELVATLATQGITEPFPIQEQTISDTLAGRDVCGKARTGSGKTLAFGLPILERLDPGAKPNHPSVLVLAPTRELTRQIVAVLKPLGEAVGVTVAGIYGGAPIDKQIAALRDGLDIAVATPGRLIDLLDRGAVKLDAIRHVVIDEADHMADLGFLPQVQWIMRKLRDATPQVLLFSATLDGDIDILVRDHLRDPVKHEVVDPDDDDDAELPLVHRFFYVHEMDRAKIAAAIAKGNGRTLAFTATKRGADRFARELSQLDVRVAAIHGDLRQDARERALKQFSDGKLDILVATDVAARGIHVDDIGAVLHVELPGDAKGYIHRSGRTARAGATGAVATLVPWDQLEDAEKLKRQLGLDEPTVEVFSNDPRLADLRAFEHKVDSIVAHVAPVTEKKPISRQQQARMFGRRRGRR